MKKKTKYGLIMLAVAIAVLAIDNLISDDFEDNAEYLSQSAYNEVDHTATQSSSGKKSAVKNNGVKYVWHTSKDIEGDPHIESLYPKSWKIKTNSDNLNVISGPNSLSINPLKNGSFGYTKDQATLKYFQDRGANIRQMPEISQLIQTDLASVLASKGYKIVDFNLLPEQTQTFKNNMNQIINFRDYYGVEHRKDGKLYGIDLVDTKGNPAFASFALYTEESADLLSWNYSSDLLEVKPNSFNEAKEQFLYSMANNRLHPKAIQKNNQVIAKTNQEISDLYQRDQVAIQQSNANFQAREAARWSNFNQGQAAHQARVDAWNETNMNNYNNRMTSMENQHNNFINTIREEQNMYNPNTGQYMKVESGYDNYWYNPYTNEYLPTNSTYNPNQDPNVNHHNWQQLQQYNQY